MEEAAEVEGLEDLQFELVQQIHNFGNCYDTGRFLELLKLISGSNEGGWDGKIRLP